MQILVRDADGFVLNSTVFNNLYEYEYQLSEGIDEGVFSQEYYTIHDVDLTPTTDKSIEGFIKLYFYKDGKLTFKYSATSEVDRLIEDYKEQLASTDYIIIKAYERTIMQQPEDPQYDYETIAVQRQALRDKINELEQMKKDYPTIQTYKPEYLKPTNPTEQEYDKE